MFLVVVLLAALFAAGTADAASAAMTLSSTAPAPASQTVVAGGQQAGPVSLTASGSTDVAYSMLWVHLDSGSDCAPTREQQMVRSTNSSLGAYPIDVGAFSKDIQIHPPQSSNPAGSWTVCLYLTGDKEQSEFTAGQFTVVVKQPEQQVATLSLSAPSPALQTYKHPAAGQPNTFPPLKATATGSTSTQAMLELYAVVGTACPASSRDIDASTGRALTQKMLPPGPIDVTLDFGAPALPGHNDVYGTGLVCGYMTSTSSGVAPARATGGTYTVIPPQCPSSNFTVGKPVKLGSSISWALPITHDATDGTMLIEHPTLSPQKQEISPEIDGRIEIPLDDKQQFDVQALGKTDVTFELTWTPSSDAGGHGSGCVAPNGTIVYSLPSSKQKVSLTLYGDGTSSATSAPAAAAPTLASVLATGVLTLPTQTFAKDGKATVELFLAKLRIGKVTKTVHKGKAVALKVKLTAAGKKALKKAGKKVKLSARTTFKPKGAGKRTVKNRVVTLS